MKKTIGLLAVLAIIGLIPTHAQAQRYRGNGNVTTPFGQFNMNEMMASGGDPFAAEAMREQRMMMMQQQQMMKMQQQYMQQMAKQNKNQGGSLNSNTGTTRSTFTTPRPAAKTKAKKKVASTATTTAAAKGTTPPKDEQRPAHVPGAPASSKSASSTSTPKSKTAK
jgi:hypothetical protein